MAVVILKEMINRHNDESKLCYIIVATVLDGEHVTVNSEIVNSDTGQAEARADCIVQLDNLDI